MKTNEYPENEEKLTENTALSNRIAEILMDCGMIPGRTGYRYIKTSIELVVRSGNDTCSLQKDIYASVSRAYSATVVSIDHCVRNDISRSWEQCPVEYKAKYFGTMGSVSGWKPKPKEYILTIAEHLRRRLSEDRFSLK